MPKARAKCDPELTERFQAWWESRVTDHGPSFPYTDMALAAGLSRPQLCFLSTSVARREDEHERGPVGPLS